MAIKQTTVDPAINPIYLVSQGTPNPVPQTMQPTQTAPQSGTTGSGGTTTNPPPVYTTPPASSTPESSNQLLQQAMNYGQQDYSITPQTIDPTLREIQPNELASNQLNEITAYDSPLLKRARQAAQDYAASRGILNSSIAAGNAEGAVIDRATPLALAQAQAYGQAASQNMAAQNAAETQNAINKLNADVASTGFNAQRAQQIRDYLLSAAGREDTQAFQSQEANLARKWQTGERRDAQTWQAYQNQLDRQSQSSLLSQQLQFQGNENATNRAFNAQQSELARQWQTGERRDSQTWQAYQTQQQQQWQSGENQANRDLQSALQQSGFDFQQMMQEDQQAFQDHMAQFNADLTRSGWVENERTAILGMISQERTNRTNLYGQAAASIYNNPNLTAAQQQQAVGMLSQLLGPVFNDPTFQLPDMSTLFAGTTLGPLFENQNASTGETTQPPETGTSNPNPYTGFPFGGYYNYGGYNQTRP